MIGPLTNHLWQSTLFAAAAGLLALAFRRNRAQVRYWLWFSASLKFLAPFALLIGLGSRIDWAPAAKHAATPAVSLTLVEISEPFPTVLPASTPAPARADWILLAIAGVWACGFVGIVAMRFRRWLRIRAAVRASTPIEIPSPVPVRACLGPLEPGVTGFVRPILLVPADIIVRLTPPQLEAVLAHELCHIRRLDNLTAAIHMIVEAVFWFHPLVWWIGARLVEERERACDEAVLTLGSEPRDYAEAILNVCRSYLESPLPYVPGVTGADIRKRIEGILNGRAALNLSFGKRVALASAGAAALAIPVAIGMIHAPAIRAQSVPTGSPRFVVASIKPCKGELIGVTEGARGQKKSGGPASFGGQIATGDRLLTGCVAVVDLIRSAYVAYANGYLIRDPSNPPVEGGPGWIRSARYQINAKAEGWPGQGILSGPMMQALLEDRFHLKIHRESKEARVYALTVAKGGPKLAPFAEGTCTPIDLGRLVRPFPQNGCRVVVGWKGPNMKLAGPGVTLGDFSKLLYLVVDRPVIDRTGIQGRFDLHLEFAAPESDPVFGDGLRPSPADTSDEPAGPSIFTAVQQQIGLKLQSSRGAREFVVIDHVERPRRTD